MVSLTDMDYKVTVLGTGGVGKSALTIRLVTDNFLPGYDPTIEDSYRKEAIIDGKPAVLDILDTAGQEEFCSMQDQWIRDGDGFLMMYDITSTSSFDEISALYDKVLMTKDADYVPCVLIGNKCDLENDREISKEDGQELAALWGCPFYETSAKTQINNKVCYYEIVREIRKQEQKEEAEEENGKKFKFLKKCMIL